MNPELETAARLAVSALVGLAVGIEREWSGHASGPGARFAGARTFFLLGLLGGLAGWLAEIGLVSLAVLFVAGGLALAVTAYAMAVARGAGVDGTTEAAATLVLMLGVAAGLGYLGIASGAAALVVLVLAEKTRIHGFVEQIGQQELQAALYFAVLSLVVLPILPEGPFGPLGGIRPRGLWTVVLIFSALNFAGYLARRALGEGRAYGLAGALGGLVSSTAVTLTYSRQSREGRGLEGPLGFGVLAACTVLVPRLLVVTLVLAAPLTPILTLYLLPPLLVGAAGVAIGLRRPAPKTLAPLGVHNENPLQLGSALRMALAFQAVLVAVYLAQQWLGDRGVLATAALLGFTDMDALTYSMTRLVQTGGSVGFAAQAIAIGLLSNTVLKFLLTVTMGAPAFRRVASTGLILLGLASLLGLWLGSWWLLLARGG